MSEPEYLDKRGLHSAERALDDDDLVDLIRRAYYGEANVMPWGRLWEALMHYRILRQKGKAARDGD